MSIRVAERMIFVFSILFSTPVLGEAVELHAVREYGGRGTLNQPEAVVGLSSGEVLVLDTGNHRVAVFTEDGSFSRSIGGIGSTPGRLLSPAGFDVDESGNLIIADLGNRRIQILSPDGEVLGVRAVDAGVSDVLAIAGDQYLVSRSFNRGRALFYRLDYEGGLLGSVGQRIGTVDHVGLEVSLNTFRGSFVGDDLWVAFANLSRVRRIGTDGEEYEFDVRTPQTEEVHEHIHRKLLAGSGREKICGNASYENLRSDLKEMCADGSRRYQTYLAGVGGFDRNLFVLTLGVLHQIDAEGRVLRSFALRAQDGGEAFAHRMWIDSAGHCYTVDTFHHHIVRRYDLSAVVERGASQSRDASDYSMNGEFE